MTTFTITPRDRSYWVEIVADNGSRTSERYDTEERALARLRALKQSADAIERQNAQPPGSRH